MIEQFVASFTNEHIKYIKRGNSFFFVPEEVLVHEKKNDLNAASIGLPLGMIKKNRFYPSLPLLAWLAKHSARKAYIIDKAAWLFLCGRDITAESIVRSNIKSGLVLVNNKKDENLGYGRITSNGIINLLDRGDYLRRERKLSSA